MTQEKPVDQLNTLSGPADHAKGFDVCRICVILILGIEVATTSGLV